MMNYIIFLEFKINNYNSLIFLFSRIRLLVTPDLISLGLKKFAEIFVILD